MQTLTCKLASPDRSDRKNPCWNEGTNSSGTQAQIWVSRESFPHNPVFLSDCVPKDTRLSTRFLQFLGPVDRQTAGLSPCCILWVTATWQLGPSIESATPICVVCLLHAVEQQKIRPESIFKDGKKGLKQKPGPPFQAAPHWWLWCWQDLHHIQVLQLGKWGRGCALHKWK